jgi:superoxide reductase
MTKLGEVYKCSVCGNIVVVVHASEGELVCCKKPMELMKENTVDASREKHVPVIEKTENAVKVKIGSVPHPMEENHYIEWIELMADGRSYRKFLSPGDAPEADFEITAQDIKARAYCNVHGLWQS